MANAVAAPKFFTYKNDAVKAQQPGQVLSFQVGKGYFLKTPSTTPAPRPTAPAPYDPLAPLTAAQLQAKATAQANDQLDPQIAALRAEQAAADQQSLAHQQAIQGFSEAAAKILGSLAPSYGTAYSTGAQELSGIAKGFTDQQAAQEQAAQDANRAFVNEVAPGSAPSTAPSPSAGADAAYAIGGAIPAAELAKQGVSATVFGLNQPGLMLASGARDLLAEIAASSTSDADFANKMMTLQAQRPDIYNKILDSLQQTEAAKATARATAAKVAFDETQAIAKSTAPNAALSRISGYFVDSSGNPILRNGKIALLPGYSVNKAGQIVKTPSGPGKSKTFAYSESLSSQLGYLADSHGNPLLGKNGKPIPYRAGASGTSGRINMSVSNALGYLADSTGAPILRNGKVVYMNTLAPNVQKEIALISPAIVAAKAKGTPAAALFETLKTAAAGKVPDQIIRAEIIARYGAQNVPVGWVEPGQAPPNGAPWTHASLPAAQANFENYVLKNATRYRIDPDAVVAVAHMEGYGGGIGDNGTSFGPFQLHAGGALPAWVAARGADFAQRWAWSEPGFEYALSRIAQVAGGLEGQAAVNAIVRLFERPANPANEVAGALVAYPSGRTPPRYVREPNGKLLLVPPGAPIPPGTTPVQVGS